MLQYKVVRGGIHQRFLASRKKVQMLGGGFGNGKTACACVKAIGLAMDYPGSNGLIARETYPKLNDSIRREFYKWVPKGEVKRWPTKDDNTLIFRNGSVINFRYIAQRGKASEDGFSTSNLLSNTYDWIVIDQIEDPGIQHKDLLDLMGRLRGSASYKGSDSTMPMTGPRWIMLTANPTANWVYKKLVKPYHKYLATGLVETDLLHDPHTMEPIIEIIEGSTYENRHNLADDFIQGLEATYQGQMRDRFLMGEWAAYEGLVYPSYSLPTHGVKKHVMLDMLYEAQKNGCKYTAVQGLDFGMSSPSCYLLGFTDEMGRVFILEGLYKPTPAVSTLGVGILELQEKYFDLLSFEEPIYSDPAIFKRTVVDGTGKGATTVARILRSDYDLSLIPGQNDITSGIAKINEYLMIKQGLHFDPIEASGPALYVNEELDFIDEEFTSYFWKSNGEGERSDEPNGKKDHAMDSLKYLMSRLPPASKLLYKLPPKEPEYLKWQEAR